MDEARQHHGVHQGACHQQAEACASLQVLNLMTHSLTVVKRQLHGAVKGLKYLHDANLVHGDLKGVSIRSHLPHCLFLTPF